MNVVKFVENESYKHKLAKELLISWFESEREFVCYKFKINDMNDTIVFRKNHFFVEYPVVICEKFDSLGNIWNEMYDYYCKDEFCDHKNDNCYEIKNKNDFVYDTAKLYTPSPSHEWCIRNNFYPKIIFDIAISHKGCIAYGIEIVNTNGISEKKKNNIQDAIQISPCKAVLEISADWILKQTEKPKVLQVERYITVDEDIVNNKKSRNFGFKNY